MCSDLSLLLDVVLLCDKASFEVRNSAAKLENSLHIIAGRAQLILKVVSKSHSI